MNQPGKIVITDKVYFEYFQLYKPDKKELKYYHNSTLISNQLRSEYLKNVKEYEASKRIVEVSNVFPCLLPRLNEQKVDIYYDVIFQDKSFEQVKNNQPCEAEVENNIATITKIN